MLEARTNNTVKLASLRIRNCVVYFGQNHLYVIRKVFCFLPVAITAVIAVLLLAQEEQS